MAPIQPVGRLLTGWSELANKSSEENGCEKDAAKKMGRKNPPNLMDAAF